MQMSNTRLLVLGTAHMEDVSGERSRAWVLMVPAEDGREALKEENENAAWKERPRGSAQEMQRKEQS